MPLQTLPRKGKVNADKQRPFVEALLGAGAKGLTKEDAAKKLGSQLCWRMFRGPGSRLQALD